MKSPACVTSPCAPIPPLIPLPYAWYVSGDLIFELYEGGQPSREFCIRWEHLKPIARLLAPPTEAVTQEQARQADTT